ncbi:hypothetical protein, partial [Thermococcus sp.]
MTTLSFTDGICEEEICSYDFAGFTFFGFFVKAGVQSGVIIRLQNSTGAHVFVKALYPDGFKSLGVYTVS